MSWWGVIKRPWSFALVLIILIGEIVVEIKNYVGVRLFKRNCVGSDNVGGLLINHDK